MEDIYKTPQADIIVGDSTGIDFYVVSTGKFVLLFLLTVSLYGYYWFYKHWQLQKIKTGESIRPVWRSIFAIFFVHGLFSRVDFNKHALGINRNWHPDTLAGIYVLVIIVSGVMDRLSAHSIGIPYTSVSFIPFLLLECYVLYRAQIMINLVCGDADGEQNRRLTPMNIFWIVIGICFWFVLIIGLVATFYPDIFR